MSIQVLGPFAMGGDNDEDETVNIPAATRARRVLDHYADISRRHDFKPGDLVVMKPGIDFWAHPNPGEPCCVLEVLEEGPVGKVPGRVDHGDRMNLRLCVLVIDGSPSVNLYPSRYFEPYTGPIESDGSA